ncbi:MULTISPECIES: chemoreceptor glutamine deamidase CheD [Methylomicrobium]|uniref:Probable chemoreceptor glutamine deamidase CheD n=1 Tax=Methylomicrobium album BG8 TaxID=686340 RepID=H8GMX7_METAL|nr:MULTISPECIES: chemoreceptor glutamine deamidase CheD [Methylomicrobium]EIC29529.1 chemotaxis protein [Methylomicrobium album BG8]
MSEFFSDDEVPAPNFYYDNYFDIDAVKIVPGEYYVTARPILIVTVLGSCVAVCVRDRESGIGGMHHFMLPPRRKDGESGYDSTDYGNRAMEVLIDHLLGMGARYENLEAKLFGGGDPFRNDRLDNLGRRTADFIRSYLKLKAIPIVAEDLYDRYPRKIYFFPEQGKVMVKKLIRLHNATLIQREEAYVNRLLHGE